MKDSQQSIIHKVTVKNWIDIFKRDQEYYDPDEEQEKPYHEILDNDHVDKESNLEFPVQPTHSLFKIHDNDIFDSAPTSEKIQTNQLCACTPQRVLLRISSRAFHKFPG
jgi:hypothetical protein